MNDSSGMDRKITPERWMRKRIIWLSGGLLGVILVVYGIMSLGGSSTLRIRSSSVTVSTVSEGEFQEFTPVTGTVTPLKTFYLAAGQGGRVAGVYLDEGSMVKVGDSILRLDNTDLRLDIMYREAQFFEQINNLRNTRLAMEQRSLDLRAELLDVDHQILESNRSYEQAMKLDKEGLISQNEFDRAKENFDYWTKKKAVTFESQKQDSILRSAQVQQLEGSVARMENSLEFVRKKLADLVLRAPITGQLTSLCAEVGISIGQGQRLGQIDVIDGFKLEAEIDEYYVSRIGAGQQGQVTIEGTLCSLSVSKVYPEISSGRFKVDLEFLGCTPAGLRRGQSLNARIMLADLSRAVLLPRGGFYNTTGGRWVYLVDPDQNEAFRQDVELGRQNSEVYEVLRGLKSGDKVITSSYETFEEYSRIVLNQ